MESDDAFRAFVQANPELAADFGVILGKPVLDEAAAQALIRKLVAIKSKEMGHDDAEDPMPDNFMATLMCFIRQIHAATQEYSKRKWGAGIG